MRFSKHDKIVFIGDSITEDGRFSDDANLGLSYVRYIHDYFAIYHPDLNLEVVNKGISGNRVTDLQERWEKDVIQEKTDWVSISIGVNDVWRQLDRPEMEQVYPKEFENIYRQLLHRVKEETDAKLIILEPTIIQEDVSSKGNKLLEEYVAITQKLSEEYEAIHVPMHEAFIKYIKKNPNRPLTVDGVHMNPLGRMLMTITWLESMGVLEQK